MRTFACMKITATMKDSFVSSQGASKQSRESTILITLRIAISDWFIASSAETFWIMEKWKDIRKSATKDQWLVQGARTQFYLSFSKTILKTVKRFWLSVFSVRILLKGRTKISMIIWYVWTVHLRWNRAS